jgi:plastocyanin
MRMLGLAAALIAAVGLPAAAGADKAQLVGTVGPGFTITLTDAAGAPVQHLDPGTYELVVHDLADVHDFHLAGPGVDAATTVSFEGDQTFTITLQDGVYTFQCDPHADSMVGTFSVGSAKAPSPTLAPKLVKTLGARVGPGGAVAFPAKLAAGTYDVTVRDLSKRENLHLRGTGVNRRTGVPFRGTVKWRITLAPGRYRAWSDAHPNLARTVTVT